MSLELFDAIERHDFAAVATLLAAGADPDAAHPEQPLWTPLKGAVEESAEGGPIGAVVLLLQYGAAVDGGRVPGDATPLIVAAQYPQVEAAQLLLAAGADPNVRDDEGNSPLRLAVEKRNYELTALLLRWGADKTIHDSGGFSGMSALGRAAWNLDIPVIKLLLGAGADPKAADGDGETARERLPRREESDLQMWDAAAALLNR